MALPKSADKTSAEKKNGRPEGSRDPSPAEQIRRRLPKIYEAALKSAEAGDAAAARLCIDIVKHPEQFPRADGKKP